MLIFKELKEYLMGLFKNKVKTPISKERKEYLMEVFKRSARRFEEIATRSKYPGVPQEQQLSIDLGNKKVFGIKNRILHWIENKFTYFFRRYNLFPEVVTEERIIPGTKTKVKYFNQEEQDAHTLHIREKNGDLKLYDSKGNLYDTANEISKGKKGYVAYVLTLDGRLITHAHNNTRKEEYAYRHSTLASGEPVICSGLMRVIEGEITDMNNNSGHYKPEAANLYKVVEKFKKLFSKDAKVTCFGYFYRLLQQIPLIRNIPTKKEELVEDFLERMEKKGKDGLKDELTEYEKYFAKVKEHNEQYRQTLFLASYKSPTSEPSNKPTICKKHKLKFSSYVNSYLKFLKDFDEDPEVKRMTIERSIRKIIGAEHIHKVGHIPKVKLVENKVVQDSKTQEGGTITGINVTFYYKDDYNRFIKLLDLKKFSYKVATENKDEHIINKKDADKLLEHLPKSYPKEDALRLTSTLIHYSKYVVSIDRDHATEFIRNTLQIKIDSIEQLSTTTRCHSSISAG